MAAKTGYIDFDLEIDALAGHVNACGQVLMAERAGMGGQDTADALAHPIYVVPSASREEIIAQTARIEQVSNHIRDMLGRLPLELRSPRIIHQVTRVTVAINIQHSSSRMAKGRLLQFLNEKLERMGDTDQLSGVIARIRADTCQAWTMRHQAPCVSYKANVWLANGECRKDVSIHRNGLILIGDQVEVLLPSDRPRKKRADSLGTPALSWGNFDFYRHDTQQQLEQVAEQIDASGGKSAWI